MYSSFAAPGFFDLQDGRGLQLRLEYCYQLAVNKINEHLMPIRGDADLASGVVGTQHRGTSGSVDSDFGGGKKRRHMREKERASKGSWINQGGSKQLV